MANELDPSGKQEASDPLVERVLLKGESTTLDSPGSISILRGRGTIIPMTFARDGRFKHGKSQVVIEDDFVQVARDTRVSLRNSNEEPLGYRILPPLDLSKQ